MDENWREEELYMMLETLTKLYYGTNDKKLQELFKDHIKDVESDLGILEE